VLVHDDRRISLAELLRKAGDIGEICLRYGGTRARRRIAVILPNCPALAAAIVGITDTGSIAILVPYDTNLHRLSQYLSMTDCDAVLTTSELAGPLFRTSGVPSRAIAWEASIASESISVVNDSAPTAGASGIAAHDPDDPAIITFTSGSSGKPKAVVVSHRAQITGLWNMILASAWTARRNRQLEGVSSGSRSASTPCSLLIAPLTHVGGYAQLLLAVTMSGRLVLMSQWNARRACDLAYREGATALAGATPAMIRELFALTADRPLPFESFGIHGTAFRRSLIEEIRKRVPGARFSTGYGMTETSGSIAATAGAELLLRPDVCGPVLPTVDIEIVDADGRQKPPGHAGEIRVRGAMLFSGYQQAGSQFRPRTPQAWYHTGDVGVLDEDGFLTLMERSSDAIKMGSHGVHCSKIERYLDGERYGNEVVAVGAEDGKRLLVGIAAPRMDIDESLLKHRLNEVFEIPEDCITVLCRPDFPRTASGKIDRRELAALAERTAQHAVVGTLKVAQCSR
jgi:acyl-CoA synthetase (AMP-forming)/AMP-acid ligase II